MERIVMDCGKIRTKEDFHNALAKAMDFPDWYGGNLDALHDFLTSLCEETRITFIHFPALPFRSGGLLNVLHDSESENEKLEVSFVTN